MSSTSLVWQILEKAIEVLDIYDIYVGFEYILSIDLIKLSQKIKIYTNYNNYYTFKIKIGTKQKTRIQNKVFSYCTC